MYDILAPYDRVRWGYCALQASGTGTPEPGGLTSSQGLEVVRGCFGLNMMACDLVEVSPPFDTSGNTSLLAADLIYEMLCSMPGCIRKN